MHSVRSVCAFCVRSVCVLCAFCVRSMCVLYDRISKFKVSKKIEEFFFWGCELFVPMAARKQSAAKLFDPPILRIVVNFAYFLIRQNNR